jgi:hypothetical protein
MVAPGVQPIGFGMGTKVGLGKIATASFFWVAREFLAELNEEPLRLATARTRTNSANYGAAYHLDISPFADYEAQDCASTNVMRDSWLGSMTFLPDAFKS